MSFLGLGGGGAGDAGSIPAARVLVVGDAGAGRGLGAMWVCD
jgi:hypothetical protein